MEKLTFKASYEPVVKESETVHVYVFEPPEVKHNLVFLHGIGNGNIPYLMWFGERFKKANVKTWFLILPYHSERAPAEWKGGEPYYHHSPSYCVQRFYEAVQDVCDLVDVIRKDNDRDVSIMGFSFGGMIATLALAREKRIKKGILCCCGGDWRWINWYSPYTATLRDLYRQNDNEHGCKSERDCVKNRGKAEEVVGSFRSLEEIALKAPVGCYLYDPVSFAPFVEQEVLFFWAIFDRVFPYPSYRALHRLLKKKKTIFLPTGHKSSYMFKEFIARKVIRFLYNS